MTSATLAMAGHQFRFDLRAFLRNRQARFFTLALPVGLLVIFAAVFVSLEAPVTREQKLVQRHPPLAFGRAHRQLQW